jgi:hypothetical protein
LLPRFAGFHKYVLKENQSLETLRQNASEDRRKMVTKKEMPSRTACHTVYQDMILVASNAQSIIDSIDAGMPTSGSSPSCKADADSAAAKNKQPAAALLSAAVAHRTGRLLIPILAAPHWVVSVLLLLSPRRSTDELQTEPSGYAKSSLLLVSPGMLKNQVND